VADGSRSALTDRLNGLKSALGRIQDAMDLRSRQIAARARWWSETYPAPSRTGGIPERHAGLTPMRSSLDVTPDRGRILRATDDVPAGEILIAEPYLLRVPPREECETWPEAWRQVAAFAARPAEERAMMLELHDAHTARRGTYAALARDALARGLDLGAEPEEAATFLGILRTNGFGNCPGGTLSVYPAIAMIAHDCAPSCDRFVEGDTLFVQARRDLAAGDEITISYVPPNRPDAVRLTLLRARYGFVCGCSLCAPVFECGDLDTESLTRAAHRMEAEYLTGLA